jgi:N-acetylglucosaminyldiphosphoundecaprenol N-acetyl-beta-D-mannosaminyltransferase
MIIRAQQIIQIWGHNIAMGRFMKIQGSILNFYNADLPEEAYLLPYSPQKNHIHLVAVSTINASFSNPDTRRHLNQGILICDSKPLSIALNHFRAKHVYIRGADFFRRSLRMSPEKKRHVFVVADEFVQVRVHEYLKETCPHITNFTVIVAIRGAADEIVKWLDHGITSEDAVWIALGSPKQDVISSMISDKFKCNVIAIGAGLEFATNASKEVPNIVRGSGFEWLFRLLRNPRKLFRRYMVGNFLFLLRILKNRGI